MSGVELRVFMEKIAQGDPYSVKSSELQELEKFLVLAIEFFQEDVIGFALRLRLTQCRDILRIRGY